MIDIVLRNLEKERAKDLESRKIAALSIYIGSAIHTRSEIGIVKEFIIQVKATLGLTLYILTYGIDPMFLTPLQEMASYGRNPVSIIVLAIFVLFNVSIVVSNNFSPDLAFQFFPGFIGSPALATGGAFMAEEASSLTSSIFGLSVQLQVQS